MEDQDKIIAWEKEEVLASANWIRNDTASQGILFLSEPDYLSG